VFDLAAARTGLLPAEAEREGFNARTVDADLWEHNAYYPHAQRLRIRITGDRDSEKLLGAQIIGPASGAVAKRIDIFASMLQHGGTVDALNDLDLSYTPPLGSPWDAVQQAAQQWLLP
jgi:NADPH-dependent 2,4-dienoyl-CoA reductase/sulfur reductase-like enzyme